MCSKSVILWAEDNEDDACLMEHAIHKAAISSDFIRVVDGVQATEYLSGQGEYSDRCQYPLPHLLLLDIKMPRMSGLDVLEWKQSKPEFQDVNAVVLSSSGHDCDKQEAFRLGAKGYLVKPSTIAGLVVEVQKLEKELLGS